METISKERALGELPAESEYSFHTPDVSKVKGRRSRKCCPDSQCDAADAEPELEQNEASQPVVEAPPKKVGRKRGRAKKEQSATLKAAISEEASKSQSRN